eukprot:scaffold52282_cov60-Phaeocystis_antarctica.AAC.3
MPPDAALSAPLPRQLVARTLSRDAARAVGPECHTSTVLDEGLQHAAKQPRPQEQGRAALRQLNLELSEAIVDEEEVRCRAGRVPQQRGIVNVDDDQAGRVVACCGGLGEGWLVVDAQVAPQQHHVQM